MRKNNQKFFTIILIFSIIVFSGLFITPSNQTNPQYFSDFYIPTYQEYNVSVGISSTSHDAGLPILIADLGSDGNLEIIVGTDNGWLYVFNGSNNQYNLITSAYIQDIDTGLNPAEAKIYSIAMGDINNSPSTQEIIVGVVGHLSVLRWTGSGFVRNQNLELNDNTKIVTSVIIEDINNDGKNEIIACSGNPIYTGTSSHSGELYVFLSDQLQADSGDWSGSNCKTRNRIFQYLGSYWNLFAYSVIIGDPDNDGQTELISYFENSGTGKKGVIIISNTYSIEWDSSVQYPTQSYGNGYGIAVGDINQDGLNELCLGSNDGKINIFSSSTSSSYLLTNSLTISGDSLVWGLKIIDCDDDTHIELIATTIEGNLKIYQKFSSNILLENPQIGWIGAQTGAFNQIECIDIDNDNLTELIISKSGPNNLLGITESDTNSRMLIYGCITTSAEVLNAPPSTPIIVGTYVTFDVRYNRTDVGPPQGIATLDQAKVINNETENTWIVNSTINNGGGNFTIEISTSGKENGYYTLRVILITSGYVPGVVYVNLNISGSSTSIMVLSGADNSSGFWETYNETNPYVNDDSKWVEILFKDQGLDLPLIGAQIFAKLKYLDNSTVPGKESLPWVNMFLLSGGNPAYRGVYRVNIDAINVHSDNYTLNIVLEQEGYSGSELNILVHIMPIPSQLFLTTDFISVYKGENFIISAIFYDSFQGKNIVSGNVTYSLGNYSGSLNHIGFGVYQTEINTSNFDISTGNYIINLKAEATDYMNSEYNVTLDFNLKYNVILTLSNLPDRIYAGQGFSITASLTFENGSSLFNKAIIFTYFLGNNQFQQELRTNSQGEATLSIVSIDGISSIRVYAEYMGDEETNAHLRVDSLTDGGSIEVVITTVLTDIMFFAPYFGIAAIVVAVSGFSYHQFKIIPKRRKRVKELEKTSEIYKNLTNIQHIIVLNKSNGLVIYERSFMENALDSSLIGGFIKAISSFGTEISQKPKKGLEELTYENFRILINEGKLVIVALILNEKATESLSAKLKIFTEAFEESHLDKLLNWKGDLEVFADSIYLVDDIFEFSIMLPQKITPASKKVGSITELQKSLLKLSEELVKEKQFFYVNQLISLAIPLRKEDRLEIWAAVYDLIKKKYFVPILI